MCFGKRREIIRKESYENLSCIDILLIHSPTKRRDIKMNYQKAFVLGELGHTCISFWSVCLQQTKFEFEWLFRWCVSFK